MPQLKIIVDDSVQQEVQFDSLTLAKTYVNELPEQAPETKFVFSTFNPLTLVENTVTLRRN